MSMALSAKLEILRSRVDYQGGILGFMCAVVTLLLMVGQQATYLPIQERLAEDRAELLAQVLPSQYFDNDPLSETVSITDEQFSSKPTEIYLAKLKGVVNALVFQIETEGYGGTITLMVAVNTEGEILGLRTLSHKETPGLADKIEIGISDWITRFNGESFKKTDKSDWKVKKDGGKFDQFTGATITPRAVVKGVVSGLEFYARHANELSAAGDSAASKKEVSAP